jgi:hypothetical protein
LPQYRQILFDESSRALYLNELRARIDRAARQTRLTGRVAACM